MAEYTVPVEIEIDKEEEKHVLELAETINEKLKETLSLAGELVSVLTKLDVSFAVGDN